MKSDFSDLRGFNYQLSTGTTSLENWLYYDPAVYELELRRGKEYFPTWNTIRLWLSWDAYFRKPEVFKQRFESMLAIADRFGLKVIACLFNRWHDVTGFDNGGVYLDNFLFPPNWAYYVPLYEEYVKDVVGTFGGDPRIIMWDICNEPWPYNEFPAEVMAVWQPEMDWLTRMRQAIKAADQVTPVCVSVHNYLGLDGLRWVDPISDVFSIHPYYMCSAENLYDLERRARYDRHIADYADYARSAGKPIVATETCWGADTDTDRAEIIRFTLETLTKYNMGFIPHALHYGMTADLHSDDDSFMGETYLPFINKDGSLRAGHDVYNNY
ncbi:MAG: glycoside hydrolase family 5 protein [Propionibacteriaceae bacterium]|jgi:endo-1,4-beta-mannosidase|nr:glycoside hydrolase family 5 protein [Propionibacteriaceae bacterium]